MRLGIDATALPARLGGAGNYIRRLVGALRELDTGDRLIVFTKARDVERLGPWDRNSEPCVVRLWSRPQRLVWEQVALPGLLRRLDIDLLHSPHYTVPLADLRTARVVTLHDMIFFLFPEYHQQLKLLFFRGMIRAAVRLADHIIADSECTRTDAMRLLGLAPDSITTVHLAADESFAPVREPAGLDSVKRRYGLRRPFVLTVCTLEPRKNLVAAVRAMARLRERGVERDLVVVGARGWGYASLSKTVERLRLSSSVTFLGFVPSADLPALYSAADVFLYPSLYEGFGLPVLEAMACGTPVVASRRAALEEIVGSAGLLCEPADDEDIAARLATALGDAGLRDRLRRAALERAAAFSWRKTALETYEVYRRVTARRTAG